MPPSCSFYLPLINSDLWAEISISKFRRDDNARTNSSDINNYNQSRPPEWNGLIQFNTPIYEAIESKKMIKSSTKEILHDACPLVYIPTRSIAYSWLSTIHFQRPNFFLKCKKTMMPNFFFRCRKTGDLTWFDDVH